MKYRNFLRNNPHYIIIGGNDIVPQIVKQTLSNHLSENGKYPYIVIQTSREVEPFRRELFSLLDHIQQRHVIIYYGDRTSDEDIEELIFETANEVYIIGEDSRTDDIESYHDTMNMKTLQSIRQIVEDLKCFNTANKLTCRVMFEYQTTFSVFQFSDISNQIKNFIDFKPFNYYEMWTQKIFVNTEIDSNKLASKFTDKGFLPLEGTHGIDKDSNSYVHLFVVGMSRMGIAMALEAAHLAHYPNFVTKKIRTKITLIDKNAVEEKDFFMGRFKELFDLSRWRYGTTSADCGLEWSQQHIPAAHEDHYLGGDFIDVEWEFINGGIEQNSVQGYILSSANESARVTIAICLPESNRSHAAALYLDKKIYESSAVQQVLVYNRYGGAIIESLTHKESARHPYLNKLRSFGSPRECFDINFLKQSERIGEEIGNKYEFIKKEYILKALKKANQAEGKSGYKGKSKAANAWSNIYNGNTMWGKLRSVNYREGGFSQEDRDLLSDVEHNRWNVEQLLMHFRPLTRQEQEDLLQGRKDKEDLKGEMAHLNICSNKRLMDLSKVDVAARAYDEGLTDVLPEIYKQITR